MKYCVDFDDLCDETAYQLDALLAWKEARPALKVTLFTIPQRTSDETIKMFNVHDWIALAPHGWRHTRGECLSWAKDEAAHKLSIARMRGINAPIFRAPGWLIDGDTYEACREMRYAVASHKTFRVPHTGIPEYVVDYRAREVKSVHSHLTNNPSTDNISDLDVNDIPDDAEFYFAHELAEVL